MQDLPKRQSYQIVRNADGVVEFKKISDTELPNNHLTDPNVLASEKIMKEAAKDSMQRGVNSKRIESLPEKDSDLIMANFNYIYSGFSENFVNNLTKMREAEERNDGSVAYNFEREARFNLERMSAFDKGVENLIEKLKLYKKYG